MPSKSFRETAHGPDFKAFELGLPACRWVCFSCVTVAAVGFAGLLVVILKSGEVQGILSGLIRSALSVGG